MHDCTYGCLFGFVFLDRSIVGSTEWAHRFRFLIQQVTKGASKDGNAIVTYAADSHTLYGYLQHWPAATHPANATRDIYDWDGKFYLGMISEANQTHNVIGNVNEFGLAITESTWGGCACGLWEGLGGRLYMFG